MYLLEKTLLIVPRDRDVAYEYKVYCTLLYLKNPIVLLSPYELHARNQSHIASQLHAKIVEPNSPENSGTKLFVKKC